MAELMITAINIFLLSFVAGYIGYPMISKALNKRKTQIAEQIHTASRTEQMRCFWHRIMRPGLRTLSRNAR